MQNQLQSTTLFRKRMDSLESVYISFLIAHTMISQIIPLERGFFQTVRTAFGFFLMLCGSMIIVIELLKNHNRFLRVNSNLLIGYIFVSLLSCAVNFKYGFTDNIKSLIWSSIHYFVVYYFAKGVIDVRAKQYLGRILYLPIFVWTLSGAVSLLQFIFQFSSNINRQAQGWYYNRLFGVYRDPNFASVTSICVIFATLFLYKNSKHLLQKALLIFCMLIQLMYVLLAQSRGSWLAGAISLLAYLFIATQSKRRKTSKAKCCLYMIIHFSGILCALFLLKGILAYIPPMFEQEKTIEVSTSVPISPQKNGEKISLERTDLEKKDLTNGRLYRWKSILSVYLEKPLLGVSPQNLAEYSLSEHPDNLYMIKNGDFHNGYLAVIVGTGTLGFILVFLFIIKSCACFYLFFIKMRSSQEDACIAAIICMVAVSGMIIQEIFWINSVGTLFFWMSLGYLNNVERLKNMRLKNSNGKIEKLL